MLRLGVLESYLPHIPNARKIIQVMMVVIYECSHFVVLQTKLL